jgi:membrane protease YdiL (CAAX protease family)
MQTVKSFGVLSVVKTFGIIGAVFGLLAIPIGAIAAKGDTSFFQPLHLPVLIGSGALLGFIYGAVGAVVYNLVARWTGGIEVEL